MNIVKFELLDRKPGTDTIYAVIWIETGSIFKKRSSEMIFKKKYNNQWRYLSNGHYLGDDVNHAYDAALAREELDGQSQDEAI